ncbi:DUF1365 domain-containing protein [Nocardia stercoris]|uniref:DUF1365 domain-containing protein n=1 Tax=Nocardia stercoris TaxID=2483361 RepID=A0A3M2KRZ6_9NOCA|nr:DUF1365 domain-containing protein [Nocardia stercoris]RMI27774.1 DUF1365 domain-containing protein [Nocardia stercoris]
MKPQLVYTRTAHTRRTPLPHSFRYRGYSWLVDLDELPRLPRWLAPLARFEPADHLGDRRASLRDNIDSYLAEHGIDLRGGRILMFANARVLGWAFDPLSVFWCRDDSGRLVCVVAEVHNTYGERYRYLLRPDASGRAEVAKRFYVSPFNEVAGRYRIRVPEPGDRLFVSVVLDADGPRFAATVTGRCRPADTRSVLRAALTVPIAPLRVSALIRWQGIRLWAGGLAVVPRPPSQETDR